MRRRGVEGTGPVPSGEWRQGQPSPHRGAQRTAACTETTGGTGLGPSGSARGNPSKEFCNGLLASRDHPERPQPRRLLKASGVVRHAKVTADIYGDVLYPPTCQPSSALPCPSPPSSAAQTLARHCTSSPESQPRCRSSARLHVPCWFVNLYFQSRGLS